MRTIGRIRRKGKRQILQEVSLAASAVPAVESRVALIQALIPVGLAAVAEALAAEVTALAGARYARTGGQPTLVRWGQQPGSVYLADQKVPVAVPRVRDQQRQVEVPLATYQQLQTPRALDEGLFRRVLGGLACGEYAACAEAVPVAFGLARSTVSRRFVRASARQLRTLLERPLTLPAGEHWIALFIDGKSFAADALVIALGITTTGRKQVLGFVQTATENERVCAAFLRQLEERGFTAPDGLLVVLDGAKGLRAAIRTVFGATARVQRCQWHKRENVVRHLAKGQQAEWRRKLQAAYERPTYEAAKAALTRLHRDLRLLNASAAASLLEGLEETLTLHQLGLVRELGASFRTTNALESVMAQVERRTRRVTHWRTSDQKQRWCAAALLAVELRLRKVKGYRHLGTLATVLRQESRSCRDAA
ncbi:MAG: IS256 family transposase [Candidatus Acidiferrales bacterium]